MNQPVNVGYDDAEGLPAMIGEELRFAPSNSSVGTRRHAVVYCRANACNHLCGADMKRLTDWGKTATIVGVLLLSAQAHADVFVTVSTPAQLSFQTSGALIYLRNLNVFDSNALGCCYNYWIDTSTPEGKNIFAILLEDIALNQPIVFGLPNGYASGAATYSGNNE